MLDFPCLAVDCLVSPDGNRAVIIELSSFIQMETPRQLLVDGQPGALVGAESLFVPGEVWLQELALERFFTTKWIRPRRADADA